MAYPGGVPSAVDSGGISSAVDSGGTSSVADSGGASSVADSSGGPSVAYSGGVPVAEVVRSGFVEGRHHGSVAVLSAAGELVAAVGDTTGPIFPRSSNKPMQAVGMLRAGLRVESPADLAIVCASHYGEDFHVARVRELLRGGGLDESALRCPPSLPLSEAARDAVLRTGGGPARILMNCSGKHTGMLLTCLAAGWPIDAYWQPDHSLQAHLRAAVQDLTGEEVAAVGVDGCGAPVFAVSLAGLARAFLRLVTGGPGSVEAAVADAMRAHPELVAGTGADDTRLMRGVPGLLAKGGAEGVAAVAVPGVGAVAMKIDDGAQRARMPVLAHALRRLGLADEARRNRPQPAFSADEAGRNRPQPAFSADEAGRNRPQPALSAAAVLDELARVPVHGGGEVVGEVRGLAW